MLKTSKAVIALSFLAISLSLTTITPCFAATDQADLSVGMKTLPLLTDKITGTATLAIIFNPADRLSKEEAAGIKAILDSGFEAPGDLKLVPLMVPADDLTKMTGSKIAILTGGLNSHFSNISDVASANKILTMSNDLSCVQANKCILGIVSKPHVEIYFSKTAADAAKIGFGQVFSMLVKQVQ